MTEHQIQCAIVDLLRVYQAQGKLMFWATPNGEYRNPITGAKLKRQGVQRGVADLFVVTDQGLEAWEVKTPKGRQSDDQKRWQVMLESYRIPYRVIRSTEQAQAVLRELFAEAA